MESQLQRLPGFDKRIFARESRSYIETLQDQKHNLVYLMSDSENVLDVLDPKKYYIVGGLVDRNRWKGITIKKAEEQGIQTTKLPIGGYLKICSSQVLTVNRAIEILLKFVEMEDWKVFFFQMIPQRKRCGDDSTEGNGDDEAEHDENLEKDARFESKKKRCRDDLIDENSEDGQSESRKEGVEAHSDC